MCIIQLLSFGLSSAYLCFFSNACIMEHRTRYIIQYHSAIEFRGQTEDVMDITCINSFGIWTKMRTEDHIVGYSIM